MTDQGLQQVVLQQQGLARAGKQAIQLQLVTEDGQHVLLQMQEGQTIEAAPHQVIHMADEKQEENHHEQVEVHEEEEEVEQEVEHQVVTLEGGDIPVENAIPSRQLVIKEVRIITLILVLLFLLLVLNCYF